MGSRRVVVLMMVAWVSLAVWSSPAAGQRPSPEEGQRIYKQNCSNCHGSAGQGDGVAAAQLDPKPADLTATKTQAKNDAELLEVIKFGRPGTAMPSWMSELDERDMRHVLAYIRSLVP